MSFRFEDLFAANFFRGEGIVSVVENNIIDGAALADDEKGTFIHITRKDKCIYFIFRRKAV